MRLSNIPKKTTPFIAGIRRAPKRDCQLNENDKILAIRNALRYVPQEFHQQLTAEFAAELEENGRIYGYRFRPEGRIYGKSIDEYAGKCLEGKAFQVMIDNNLDFETALYPYELVTYGETGQVCQNWMQYLLIKQYLSELTDQQTLVIESGHPLGLFHSPPTAPRVIITNGLLVGEADDLNNFKRFAALGVSNYGQMTAGGWMYIGPQGIVHGTYNTLLNAARMLDEGSKDMDGKLFISSGLGGMSGAQGKACKIAKGVAIVAEVDASRIKTRLDQGWVDVATDELPEAFAVAKKAQKDKTPLAIAYHGNVVELLRYALANKIKVDLLSDQTSCHEVYEGGYCPVGTSFEKRTELLKNDRRKFKELVDEGLKEHYKSIRALSEQGCYFFDYGNSFLKALFDSGIKEISKNKTDDKEGFIWPSYVEDIMGPLLFDYGYGPFRWVCLSGLQEDLDKTDLAAMECIDKERRIQDYDNWLWIKEAKENKLVVGTKARILYQDASGRTKIALAFNEMIRNKEVGPIMIGRDHHDVSGTDSPFRETSNIKDGSQFTADMAVQCFAGNVARGMSLVTLHNGGGVGIGKAINGGFGLVLDGSQRVDEIIYQAMLWDVMGGVARRAWAGNPNSLATAEEYNRKMTDCDEITLPYLADMGDIRRYLQEKK